MKKIGILYGMENTFPQAFVDRVNQKAVDGITAESVRIDKVLQGEPLDYAVIVDRISQDIPFYRAMLKNAAICGTAVINNPFWFSADEKFFNNALATKIGVPVPKTVLLPSKQRPTGTEDTSFRNLAMPLDWEGIFNYVGFPAYMKPYDGGGWRDVYKLHDIDDFFNKYDGTGQLVMMLQEEVKFDDYFRCYCIGQKHVRIMRYEPRNPHHLRYQVEREAPSQELLKTVEEYVIRLNEYLGYDLNTVEFAVRDGIPLAIDFCNPAPDADRHSVGEENFEWVVETMANYAIERAQQHQDGRDNLSWGRFVKASLGRQQLVGQAEQAGTTEGNNPLHKGTVANNPLYQKESTAAAGNGGGDHTAGGNPLYVGKAQKGADGQQDSEGPSVGTIDNPNAGDMNSEGSTPGGEARKAGRPKKSAPAKQAPPKKGR